MVWSRLLVGFDNVVFLFSPGKALQGVNRERERESCFFKRETESICAAL